MNIERYKSMETYELQRHIEVRENQVKKLENEIRRLKRVLRDKHAQEMHQAKSAA